MPFAQEEAEVKSRRFGADRLQRRDNVGQLKEGVGRILEGQHDLKERLMRQRAGWVKDLDQSLEGQLLMRVGT